ncbi:hypothetical protein [Rhizorhabdus dicambivorans]|uniref:Uncharacterized protein n=1 Tax=Rhizorhabdus dicambivorans TaxID=1850238 RepID=A0A2A4G0S4_9SPHN|nr:hypothetical protein [Rhizorhabdus dicambivorans]ATE63125.1 hypothetical protein CMV14_00865 [Rhizorhabdus dicambivorans]PCE43302.1 hypothetical protein COO09_05905 [Rhizorhabdus dicambivorans]
MKSQIVLNRYDGGTPPAFSGYWQDIPLNVTLDLSAVLKLAGHVQIDERHELLAAKRDTVIAALSRLAEMGQIETRSGRAETMLSALDLD